MSTTASPDDIVATQPAPKPSFGDVPLACIRPSKTNPRKIFNDDDLNDLAKSIKVQGVAQPILLRPIEIIDDVTYFEIVAGERRFRASGLAGMPTVPAIVRELSDQAAYEIQVLENLQRVDLHPLEEAEGFEVMMSKYKDTADQLAEKIGKSKAYIYASLKLCALEEAPRQAFYEGKLTKSTALLVARIPVKSLQIKCVNEIAGNNVMSTRAAADHIARNYTLSLTKATFEPEDLDLCKKAGACSACPKRAGNQPILFADVAADVCTDPVCFKAKGDAHTVQVRQIAISSGKTVITGDAAKAICPYYSSDIRAGYVRLDRNNYDDKKSRTYGQIIGKDHPAIVFLESPHDNTLIKVVKLADIKQTLAEKGVVSQAALSKAKEKEQEEVAKREREYRNQLFLAIHHSTLMANLVDQDLRLVACQLFENLPGNTKPKAQVMSLRGWDDKTLAWPYRESLRTAVDLLTPAELNEFIRDCILCRELEVNTYTTSSKDAPTNLSAYAEKNKIDAKAIRDAIDAEAKAKADAKKKASEKKAAKAPAAVAAPLPKSAAPAPVTPKKGKSTTPAKPAKTAKKQPAKLSEKASPPTPVAETPPLAANAAWPFPTSSRPAREPAEVAK